MSALSDEQKGFFWENGYLMAPGAVTSAELGSLRRDFNAWVEESRAHSRNYG